jgi:hypothetical protein
MREKKPQITLSDGGQLFRLSSLPLQNNPCSLDADLLPFPDALLLQRLLYYT